MKNPIHLLIISIILLPNVVVAVVTHRVLWLWLPRPVSEGGAHHAFVAIKATLALHHLRPLPLLAGRFQKIGQQRLAADAVSTLVE